MNKNDLIKICKKVKINTKYQYDLESLYNLKMNFLKHQCEKILDVGKGSRKWFKIFTPDQIITLDINKYEGYPDILDDICNLKFLKPETFDAVICNSVLEHVYSPDLAVKNIYNILKKNGYIFGFVPFLWRYHAPDDLKYQDFYRFSKDGIAFLFRDFNSITLYPFRGKYSTILNLHQSWKYYIEKIFGQKINYIIDKLFGNRNELKQVSGYVIWAIK
ncbi:MAG: class I SAM-dependent methyltransferase [Candidatus Helarchaeota archaeon]